MIGAIIIKMCRRSYNNSIRTIIGTLIKLSLIPDLEAGHNLKTNIKITHMISNM